jgi:hypothetical protein
LTGCLTRLSATELQTSAIIAFWAASEAASVAFSKIESALPKVLVIISMAF